MFIDNEEILSEIRESSIKNFIDSLESLYSIWKYTTSPFISKLPVMFQPVLFNGLKIEEGAISFVYSPPIILNEDGEYTDALYSEIYEYHINNPKLTCYSVYRQIDDNHLHIEYEDMLGCLDIGCVITDKGIEMISKEKVDRIPILSYSSSSLN